jgi:hypothetical protein
VATIEIHAPMIITARLLPGVKLGEGFISLEPTERRGEFGKPVWKWYIDIPAGEFEGDDLMGWSDHRGMMGDLIAFLESAADGYPYTEGEELFPKPVVEWAKENADDLYFLREEIEELGD